MKHDQAFPVHYNGHEGMTLRDYFAAKAMQLIMSGKTLVGEANADGGESENSTQNKPSKKNGNGSLSQEQIFRFYELPPTKLPSKITGSDN